MKNKNNNNLSIYIGSTIRERRKNKQLTQTDLADMVGTQQPSIAQLEGGQRLPSLRFLTKVSESLGLEIGLVMKDKVLN